MNRLQHQPRVSHQRFLPPRRIGRPLEEEDFPPFPDQSDAAPENDGGGNGARQEQVAARLPSRPPELLQTILNDGNPFQPEQAD